MTLKQTITSVVSPIPIVCSQKESAWGEDIILPLKEYRLLPFWKFLCLNHHHTITAYSEDRTYKDH